MKKSLHVLLTTVFILYVVVLRSQPVSSAKIDSVANLVLKTFDVPGIAVAVVKDDKIIHAKGYGVRSLSNMKKVDAKPSLVLLPTARHLPWRHWVCWWMKVS